MDLFMPDVMAVLSGFVIGFYTAVWPEFLLAAIVAGFCYSIARLPNLFSKHG